jgi:hypothetical protein
MSMHLTHQQEEFSRAFVHAVVSVAGFRLVPPAVPDDDSVDLSIAARGPLGTVRSPRLDVQLKCFRGLVETDPWSFPLKRKNYDELRHVDFQAPRILVVVAVPESIEGWLEQDETRLLLRRCGYWLSLRGLPPTGNVHTLSVQIPRGNVFSVESVKAMMQRVGNGGWP